MAEHSRKSRPLIHFHAAGMLGCFLIFNAQNLCADTQIMRANEVVLPLAQAQKLEADGPFSDVILELPDALWIAGQTSLWRWSITKQSLSRIGLPKTDLAQDKLKFIEKIDNGFLIATHRSIFHFSFNPQKLIRYDHPRTPLVGDTLAVFRSSDYVWWIHQSGIVKFDTRQISKTNVLVADVLKGAQHCWFDADNQTVWWTEGGKISVLDLRLSPPQSNVVHQSRESFIDITGSSSSVYLHTNFTVLKFGRTSQQLEQAIPVESNKKLLSFNLHDDLHSYLFNDRLFETFDLKTKTQAQALLNIPQGVQVKKIRRDGLYAAVLYDRKVSVFELHPEPASPTTVTSAGSQPPKI